MNNSMKKLSIVFVLTASLVSTRAHAQVVIANNSVKATDVSKSDLREVFTGGSASLAGSRVTPVMQKSGSAHAAFLVDYVGKTDAALGATWRSLVFSGQASMPKSVDSDAAMVEYVARTPGAIGYVGKGSPHEGVKVLVVR
jgi:ABC-type phosphate transport system substrate-binding protein